MVVRPRAWRTEAMHVDIAPLAQLWHQLTDVHSGAAVHEGRELPSEERDPHAASVL